MNNVTPEQVIEHLLQLRATLAHMLRQPNIGAKRFNETREQIMQLDAQLRWLGKDPEVLPQMNYQGTRPSRRQTHQKKKGKKWSVALMRRVSIERSRRDEDN